MLHEIDHLDGILFLDRVESLVDDVFRRKSYASGSGPAGLDRVRLKRGRLLGILRARDRRELKCLAWRADRVVLVLGADDTREAVSRGKHQVEDRRGETDERLEALAHADLVGTGRGHGANVATAR